MGKRRIRLIRKIKKNAVVFGVDQSESRRKEAEKEFSIFTFDSVEAVLHREAPDIAFVCTSPESHAEVIAECLSSGAHVFSELNLIDLLYEQNMKRAHDSGLVLFLSSTFLYRKETAYIKKRVAEAGRGSYCYHVGQYLPDWHPWENYRSYFVANKRTNGCRELLAIELPWLIDAFGPIDSLCIKRSQNSALDIPYKDTVALLVEHNGGTIGTLIIDVVSRKAVRNFEFFNENAYVAWNGSPTGLKEYAIGSGEFNAVSLYVEKDVEQRREYADFIIEDAYGEEVAAFFDAVENGTRPRYSFEDDMAVLRLIDEIESDE